MGAGHINNLYMNQYMAPMRYTMIASGSTRIDGTRYDPAEGSLNATPVGLGFLFTAGYIESVSISFCPSASNMRFAFKSQNRGVVANSMRDLKLLGGNADGKSLTHGDYQAIYTAHDAFDYDNRNNFGSFYWTRDVRQTGFESHYNYRGTPLMNPRTVNGVPTFNAGEKLPGAKPDIPLSMESLGKPPFKTVKMLGGRSIVSDTWSRTFDIEKGPYAPGHPMYVYMMGAGQWAHRQGYNVLYGDAHVAWYGDPQERFIWMKNPWIDAPTNIGQYTCGMNSTISTREPGLMDPRKNMGFFFWHLLDEAAGIDVGAWDYAPEL